MIDFVGVIFGDNFMRKKIGKETLRKEICSYIRDRIADGTYQAGDRIVETRLAKELHVSQAPVREAILELTAMGLLDEHPYSGTYVRKLTPADIQDIYQTRAFVEERAAQLASQNITDMQLAEAESILRKMDASSDRNVFTDLDVTFHALIIDAANSPSLKRLWENLRMVEWTYRSAVVTKFTLEELIQQHWRIYNYIKEGNTHAAGAYMYLHIQNFGEEFSQYIKETGFLESPQ